jgi:hypothetical protein
MKEMEISLTELARRLRRLGDCRVSGMSTRTILAGCAITAAAALALPGAAHAGSAHGGCLNGAPVIETTDANVLSGLYGWQLLDFKVDGNPVALTAITPTAYQLPAGTSGLAEFTLRLTERDWAFDIPGFRVAVAACAPIVTTTTTAPSTTAPATTTAQATTTTGNGTTTTSTIAPELPTTSTAPGLPTLPPAAPPAAPELPATGINLDLSGIALVVLILGALTLGISRREDF